MAEPYNLTNITNADNFYELTAAANEVSGGLFGTLLLLTTFILLFLAFNNRLYSDSKKSFAAASLITSIASVLIRLLNFIPDSYMFTCFLITGLALVWLRFD